MVLVMVVSTFVIYLPVPGVDAALVLHDLAPLARLLQPHGQYLLHPVLVLVGVRQEHVVRLLLRREYCEAIFRIQMLLNQCTQMPSFVHSHDLSNHKGTEK